MSEPPDVKTVRYVFRCVRCDAEVSSTLPEIRAHGWIDVSTFGRPNRWVCPVHGRGFVLEPGPGQVANRVEERIGRGR